MRTLSIGLLLASAVLAGVVAVAVEPAGVSLSARLVEPERNSARGAATVAVEVTGVSLTDPATANEVPKPGQAHLHYQVDDGPVVATTTPKLSFHGLRPGDHQIVVALAANDHSPLGPEETLSVNVPPSAKH